jgi:uncharacterized protein YkwD
MPRGPPGVDGPGVSNRSRQSVARTATKTALCGLAVALGAASPAAASAGTASVAQASQAGCGGAETATTNVRRIRKALLCLHNTERRSHGLSKMRLNRDLTGVATKHARDMTSRHYFAHYSRGHRDHMDRIASSSYRPSAGCWTAGENLFFSVGAATPGQLFSAWMQSPAHRQNIERAGWHDFGLGVVNTSPSGDSNGLTIVALFGVRGPCS